MRRDAWLTVGLLACGTRQVVPPLSDTASLPAVGASDPVVAADTGAFAGAAAPLSPVPDIEDFSPPTDTAWAPAADVVASWDEVEAILNARCTPCHIGGTTAGLRLSDGHTSLLAGHTPSCGMPYVAPFDPQGSYLWRKLQGTHTTVGGTGLSMPSDQERLPRAERDVIAAWIRDGALPSVSP
ncbi:MAG: hypothetical protein RLZZ383_842 [Pseudomonadota bacterium]